MKRFKTITRYNYVPRWEKVEEKVPVWWYRFLLWLFGHEESKIDMMLSDQRKYAWDKGYSDARNHASKTKEKAMQDKLHELGYEIECNFPIARKFSLDESPDPPVDPKRCWEINLSHYNQYGKENENVRSVQNRC